MNLFEKISSSSSEVSGAVFIPDEPKDENINITKKEFLNLMILNLIRSFLAFRVEGDKVSIKEKIKELNQELELNKLKH